MTFPTADEKWGPLQSYCYGVKSDAPAKALFFHANGFSAHTYNDLLTQVAETLSIRAFDLQGHGASDAIESVKQLRRWRLYRSNIEMALERNEGGILIGHSMGALSSLFTAMHRPELVKALVLLEPVFLAPSQLLMLGIGRLAGLEKRGNGLVPRARARRQYFDNIDEATAYFLGRKGLKTWPKSAIEAYAQSILRPRRDGAPGMELSLQPELEAQNFSSLPVWRWPSKPLAMPILLAHGPHASSTVYPARVDWLRKLAPNLQVKVHEKTGHMMPIDAPDWTASVVKSFLESLD